MTVLLYLGDATVIAKASFSPHFAVAVVIYVTLLQTLRCPLKESDHLPMESSMVEYPALDTRGYMVSFRFYEQQTQGLHNLIQFQCVAYSYGLRVVEPFVTNSMFTIPFQDFYNINQRSI